MLALDNSELVCPNVLVLGGGLEPTGYPSAGSILRAQTAAEYYKAHPKVVEQIICCGAYSSSMLSPPPEGTHEAGWMKGLLRSVGVPESVLGITESRSLNTFRTVIELMQLRELDDLMISRVAPLGVVTTRAHFMRVAPILKKGLDLDPGELVNIPVKERLGLKGQLIQAAGVVVTRAVLIGIRPDNIEDMERAHRRFAIVFRRPMQ